MPNGLTPQQESERARRLTQARQRERIRASAAGPKAAPLSQPPTAAAETPPAQGQEEPAPRAGFAARQETPRRTTPAGALTGARASGAAGSSATAAIPGVGQAIGWFEKMFPVLWMIISPKITPDASILLKAAGKLLWFLLPIIWPLASLVSFLGLRNLLILKLPASTSFEVVASIIPLALLILAIYALILMMLCFSAGGWFARLGLRIFQNIDIECGF